MLLQLTITGEEEIIGASKDSDKRYSPLWFMDAVRLAQQVEQFDLDCCSDVIGNKNVKAKRFYTFEENGLLLPYYGSMYCNWPFSSPMRWMQRIIQYWESGDIEQITVLARCDFSTRWSSLAIDFFDVVCHPRGRISFEGCDDSPDFTCVVFHKGSDIAHWSFVMEEFVGPCFERIKKE